MQSNCRKRRFEKWLAGTFARKNAHMGGGLPEVLYQPYLTKYGHKARCVRTRMENSEDGGYSRFKYWAQRTYGKSEGENYEEAEGEKSELSIGEEITRVREKLKKISLSMDL